MSSELLDFFKKEYFISRDKIQLKNPSIIKMDVKKYSDVEFVDENNINVSLSVEAQKIDSLEIKGFVSAKIDIEANSKVLMEIELVYQGSFCASEKVDDFERRVRLQLLPQLWPYLRMAVNNVSIMFSVPPIVLPTIDILQTLAKNETR